MMRWLVYQKGVVHAWDVGDSASPFVKQVIQINIPSRDHGTCYFKFGDEWLILTEELWGGPITPEAITFLSSTAISASEAGDGSSGGVTVRKLVEFADKHGLFNAKPDGKCMRWLLAP